MTDSADISRKLREAIGQGMLVELTLKDNQLIVPFTFCGPFCGQIMSEEEWRILKNPKVQYEHPNSIRNIYGKPEIVYMGETVSETAINIRTGDDSRVDSLARPNPYFKVPISSIEDVYLYERK